MATAKQGRKSYPSDLTDAQWTILEPLLPAARTQHGGRPRTLHLREVVNTLLYLNRSGCQWDMLPHDLLPKSSVYDYFARWRDDGTWCRCFRCCETKLVRVQAGSPCPVLCVSTAKRSRQQR